MKSSILSKREIRFFFLGFKVYITQSCIILHTLGSNMAPNVSQSGLSLHTLSSNIAKNVSQSWVILHILGSIVAQNVTQSLIILHTLGSIVAQNITQSCIILHTLGSNVYQNVNQNGTKDLFFAQRLLEKSAKVASFSVLLAQLWPQMSTKVASLLWKNRSLYHLEYLFFAQKVARKVSQSGIIIMEE